MKRALHVVLRVGHQKKVGAGDTHELGHRPAGRRREKRRLPTLIQCLFGVVNVVGRVERGLTSADTARRAGGWGAAAIAAGSGFTRPPRCGGRPARCGRVGTRRATRRRRRFVNGSPSCGLRGGRRRGSPRLPVCRGDGVQVAEAVDAVVFADRGGCGDGARAVIALPVPVSWLRVGGMPWPGTGLWFSASLFEQGVAVAVCRRCPVRQQCLVDALALEDATIGPGCVAGRGR